MKALPVPAGFRGVTPYLIVREAGKAIEFYKRAFGAQEIMRIAGPGEMIGHAELKIGEGVIMLADEFPDMGFRGPESLGGTPVSMMFYVENVDAQVEAAIAAGAKIKKPLQNQFYGDRSATLTDPFGHVWTIATHIEEVPAEEMQKRAAAFIEKECK
ncbi:MAG: VOC family protein [Planctomycetia bacterium]|nr:VOC family protein [Planctomycetia bacterium]